MVWADKWVHGAHGAARHGWRTAAQILVGLIVSAALQACGGGGKQPATPPTAAPAAAPAASAQPQSERPYFPLGASDVRVYKDSASGPPIVEQVTGSQKLGGGLGTVLTTTYFSDGSAYTSVYVDDANGVWDHAEYGSDFALHDVGAFAVYQKPLKLGSTFVQMNQTVKQGLDFDGDGIADLFTVYSAVTIVGIEDVDVDAGQFRACLHLQTVKDETITFGRPGGTTQHSRYINDDWYAEGIGRVKTVVAIGGDANNTYTQSLTAYKVGGAKSFTSPLALQSALPAASSSAGPGMVVTVVFDRPVDPSAFKGGGALIVHDSQGGVVAGDVAVTNATVSFTPAQPWRSGTYTATINTAAQDLIGNSLAKAYVWSFAVDTSGQP